MPRESTPLVRKSGFLEAEKFYILAYEGDVAEKKYFEDLRQSSMFNDSGSIETIPLKKEHNGGNSPLDVKKLLSKAKSEYNFRAEELFHRTEQSLLRVLAYTLFEEIGRYCR